MLAAWVLALLVACDSPGEAHTNLPGAGQWRVVNYWAIWCTPCREEIPELNTLNEAEDITVLGVNFDGKMGAELVEHSASLGIRFELLAVDPAEALGVPRISALPTTLLLNPAGEWVGTLTGPQTEVQLRDALSKLGRKS